jgi:hypothetical protein
MGIFHKLLVILKNFFRTRKIVEDKPINVIISDNVEAVPVEIKPWPNNSNNTVMWYPEAEKLIGGKQVIRGKYPSEHPKGAVVHTLAGRSRYEKRYKRSEYEMGVRAVKQSVDKGAYTYFVISRDGTVFQNFPLNCWGYHAGVSNWHGLGKSVSKDLVGIEMLCAGKVEKYWTDSSGKKNPCPEGKFAAWFTRIDKGDVYFDESECRYSLANDNIQEGWYHKLSDKQEESLKDLIGFLKKNSATFNPKYILGHDEVSGIKGIGRSRKCDPGAALSSTMTLFRNGFR